MFKLDLEKAEESDQIANICWIIEKAREFQKTIYFCFTDYAKAFDCVDHNKLWKSLKKIEHSYKSTSIHICYESEKSASEVLANNFWHI